MNEGALRSVRYYWDVFLAKPLYAILPVVATLIAGTIAIFMLPRSYYSEALVVVEAQQIPSSLVTTTVINERLQFVEQRVLARDNLLALVEKFKLFPELRASLPNSSLAEVVRQHIRIVTMTTEIPEQNASRSTMRIGFSYGDAQLASDVTSELVARFVDENKRMRISRASEATQFLVREVEKFTTQLNEREVEWNKYFTDNADALPARVPSILIELQEQERELASLNQAIPQLEEEVQLLEAELRLGVDRAGNTVSGRTRLAELEAELTQKSLVYSDIHPEIRGLVQKIEALKNAQGEVDAAPGDSALSASDSRNLPPELALIAERIAIAKPRHEALLARREDVAGRIAWLKATMARAPEVEARLDVIDREKQTLQANLDEMRSKLETARVGERLEQDEFSAQIQVLEEPEVPRYPASPNRKRLMLVLAVLAGALGLAGIYVADIFNRTIRGVFDLAGTLEGETLVVIPDWKPRVGLKHNAASGKNSASAL